MYLHAQPPPFPEITVWNLPKMPRLGYAVPQQCRWGCSLSSGSDTEQKRTLSLWKCWWFQNIRAQRSETTRRSFLLLPYPHRDRPQGSCLPPELLPLHLGGPGTEWTAQKSHWNWPLTAFHPLLLTDGPQIIYGKGQGLCNVISWVFPVKFCCQWGGLGSSYPGFLADSDRLLGDRGCSLSGLWLDPNHLRYVLPESSLHKITSLLKEARWTVQIICLLPKKVQNINIIKIHICHTYIYTYICNCIFKAERQTTNQEMNLKNSYLWGKREQTQYRSWAWELGLSGFFLFSKFCKDFP